MTSLPVMLPNGYSPVVEVGDIVKAGVVIAKMSSKREVSVNIADALSVSPHNASKYLKKNPGDLIKVGETIAVKKGLLSMNESRVESQVDGTLIRFERNSGIIQIQLHTSSPEETDTQTILCPIDGTISLCDNDRILVDTDKNVLTGISGVGGSCQAILTVLADHDKKKHVASYDLTPETIGTIILGRSFDREILLKAVGIGIAGILAESIDKTDLEYLAKKKLLLPVITVDDSVYTALQKLKGKTIFMDANTATILTLKV